MTNDLSKVAKMSADLDVAKKLLNGNSSLIQAHLDMMKSPTVQLAMEAVNSPAMKAVTDFMNSPAMKISREAESTMALLQKSMDSPIAQTARGIINSFEAPSASLQIAAELERASSQWRNVFEGFESSATRAIAEQLRGSNPFEQMVTPPTWLTSMNTTVEQLSSQFTSVFDQMQRMTGPSVAFLDEMARGVRQRWRMENAGWLPHYTTPFDGLENVEDEEVDTFLETHYKEKWPEVNAAFIDRLKDYAIDDEAKATFKEALQAHEQGLYRTVPRTLFPEIERIARQELHDGNMERPITSQHTLIEIAGDLFPHETESYGFFGLILYSALTKHLYEHCNAEQLPEISKNPIPNRHATVHGHVSYSKMKNSINTLIITDFIFQVIHAAKNRQVAAAA